MRACGLDFIFQWWPDYDYGAEGLAGALEWEESESRKDVEKNIYIYIYNNNKKIE